MFLGANTCLICQDLADLFLSGGLLLGSFSSLGSSLDERNESGVFKEGSQVGLQDGGDVDTLFGLVVLQDAAHGTSSGAQSGVEHVHELAVLTATGDNAQSARLVVSAVRGRDEFTVDLQGGEEGFKIVLFCSSVVQLSRNDVDDFVAEAKLRERN